MPNSITKSVIGIVAVAGTLAVGVGTILSALAQSAVEQNQAQAQRHLTNRYDRLGDYRQLRRVFLPGFSHPLR